MKKRKVNLKTIFKVTVFDSEVSTNYYYKKESRIFFGQILWRSEGIYDWHGRKICNVVDMDDRIDGLIIKDGVVYDKAVLRLDFDNHSVVSVYYDDITSAQNTAEGIIHNVIHWLEY
jgi:hypothetical protein